MRQGMGQALAWAQPARAYLALYADVLVQRRA
jgi:hypothetical protein